MTNYDFTESLSPIDFELLVKDLLEAELKLPFENFRDGKDNGIDLRYAPQLGNGATIVQCKRYDTKGFTILKSKLKTKELPKIQKIHPGRYILATSTSLSPAQSDELKKILNPYINTTGDIYGRERLNSLLSKHPNIERQHNKLWIGSTAIIEELLNSGIHSISKDEIEDAISSAKLYVRNESFDECLKIIQEHGVCIISGIPGIGKTTLARMLLLHFKHQGYEIVKIDDDIAEARGLHFRDKAKFYYYDDFLGQTSLSSKFNKNEDKRLLSFMEQIAKSQKSILVLTTREYILKQAKMVYEPFDRARLDTKKCIVDLEKYSRRIRAQILYNHLFFSDLDKPHVRAIIVSKKYKEIVDHKNYSPRLIQYLTSMEWVGDVAATKYARNFIRNLDNPVLLWKHAFERQIRRSSQDLLLVLATAPSRTEIKDLERAFEAFRNVRSRAFGEVRQPAEFKDSLRELEGTFVSIHGVTGGHLVSFHNPSIRDFIEPRIFQDHVFEHLTEGAVFFEQLEWCFEWAQESAEASGRAVSTAKCKKIEARMISLYKSPFFKLAYRLGGWGEERVFKRSPDFGKRLSELLSVGARFDSKTGVRFAESELLAFAQRVEERAERPSAALRIIIILKSFNLDGTGQNSPLVAAIVERLGLSPDDFDDFETWAGLLDQFPGLLHKDDHKTLSDNLSRYLENNSEDLFGFSCDDPEDIRSVADRVEILGRDLGVNTEGICSSIEDAATDREARIEETRDWEPDEEDSKSTSGTSEIFSDGEMESMFRTLE